MNFSKRLEIYENNLKNKSHFLSGNLYYNNIGCMSDIIFILGRAKMTVYEIITNKIIAELKNGVIAWQKCWKVKSPKNYITKKAYNGVNRLLLGMNGYDCPFYATFKQINDLGGSIMKNEKAHQVVFWNIKDKTKSEENEEGEIVEKHSSQFILRYYNVWNLEQTDLVIPAEDQKEINKITDGDSIMIDYKDKPEIYFHANADRAYYSPSIDEIHLPELRQFNSSADYYSVLFHEAIHSTGHSKRLNRDSIVNCDKSMLEKYSKEELIAEIGSIFLLNEAGIEGTFKNDVSYIQSWLNALENDKRMIVFAAAQAEKAANYILNK
jgi:antirestriction protein ArdC